MIEGLIQGVKYNTAVTRIYFHLRHDGEDVTTVDDASATVTVYDTNGDAILEDEALTQVGSTAIFYVDIDSTDTDAWEKAYGYVAKVEWEVSETAYEDRFLLDCVAWPFNESLVTTEEIDDMHPEWKGKKPGDWTDWTQAIEIAHKRVARELRQMRDSEGDPIYANRILDRGQIRETEIAYVEAVIASRIRITDEEKAGYLEAAKYAMPTLIYLDKDDDLVKDEDEEMAIAITLVH